MVILESCNLTFAALYSGGKDSTLAILKAQKEDIDVSCLVTVNPKKEDSYMFHKPNLHLVPKLAESMGIRPVMINSSGEKEKEIEDLKKGLEGLDIQGLVLGAVASNYQRSRIERLSFDLSIDLFAPLWHINQDELLQELLTENLKTVIVSVSAEGLGKEWLGREIDQESIVELKELYEKYGINISGEGGEYETLVLRSPNYKHDFMITKSEKSWDGTRGKLDVKEIKRRNKVQEIYR